MKELSVLVVDDMNSVRQLLKSQLNEYGIEEIQEASNGEEAFSLIKNSIEDKKIFDLFLVDINMPGMNGITLLKNIRETSDYFQTPVIMVTTENEKDFIVEAALVGATDYLVKPFDEETFAKKIDEALNRR